jgi:hypothetical protein
MAVLSAASFTRLLVFAAFGPPAFLCPLAQLLLAVFCGPIFPALDSEKSCEFGTLFFIHNSHYSILNTCRQVLIVLQYLASSKNKSGKIQEMRGDLVEIVDEIFAPYHCSAEWHFARMRPGPALIYPWALKVSKKYGQFYCSTVNMAEYFGCSRGKIDRGIEDLTESGFFEVALPPEPFKPGVYTALHHKEWAKQHPGRCVTKLEFDWSKSDELGQALYAASGGRVKLLAFQLTLLRNSGLDDTAIASKFKTFLAEKMPMGKEWRSVIYQFRQSLSDASGPKIPTTKGVSPSPMIYQ